MTRTPSPEAYHEAGHAVVGRRCGRRVLSIRLGRRLGGGRVDFVVGGEVDDTWVLRRGRTVAGDAIFGEVRS